MNSLSYAILAILTRKSQTGYELGKQLETLWASKLSQIYPLLSRLEKKRLVTSEHILQTGKPNKIKYHITETGLETLKQWIKQSPTDPVLRDEFLIKIHSIWLSNAETAVKLLLERLESFEKKLKNANEVIEILETTKKEEITNPQTDAFCSFILYKRRKKIVEEEVEWCRWVLEMFNGSSK